MKKYVAYYRVSTGKQGVSGLGLDAQKASVKSFIYGGEVVGEHTDIESGKNSVNRPALIAAIKQCKKENAILIIAKLDRLSRNLRFIATLMETKVKFFCCDIPDATDLTVHIFAAIAEDERKTISKRTIAALAELKKRGIKLGNPYKAGDIKKDGTVAKESLGEAARLAGVAAIKKKAQENPQNKQAKLVISVLHGQGKTLATIASELNNAGMTTATGKEFKPEQVRRLLQAS